MQLDLLLPPPRARRRDPQTSHDAAASMRKAATEQAAKVYVALQAFGRAGAGAEQIGERCGLDAYAVRKRLPELEAAGQVVVVEGVTRKTRSGRSERVWRVA
jgi:predicted ArsR family transcriptional regulator